MDVAGESRWNLGRNCEPLVRRAVGPRGKILGSEVGHGGGFFFSVCFFSQNVILEMDSSLQFLVAIEAAKFSKLPFPSFSLVIFSQQVARIEGFVKCIFLVHCHSSFQLRYDPYGSSH